MVWAEDRLAKRPRMTAKSGILFFARAMVGAHPKMEALGLMLVGDSIIL